MNADSQGPQWLQLAQTLAAGARPHLYVYVLNEHLALHRHLQLAPATESVHTTNSSHHQCLPKSQATGPVVPLRSPTALAVTMVNAVGPSGLSG